MPKRRSTRVALVTGAARNIGRAVALELARQGVHVLVHTRADEASASAVAEEARRIGAGADVVLADLADSEAVERLGADLVDRHGLVDILVNNAAIRPHLPFLETSRDEWRRIFAVTIDAPFMLSQALLPGMIESGWGRIINFVGVRAQQGVADRPASAAAKHSVIGLTRSLANEFGRHGITVNAVSPGTIMTDRDRTDPGRLEQRRDVGALGRFGEPEDIAAMVAFLASDAAGYVTGQVIGVNGGELMV